MPDIDIASQFSGPYIQAFVTAVQNQINTRQWILDYLGNLNIDNADDIRLVTIGGIIGLPWPSAPSSIYDEHGIVFGTASHFPLIDTQHGFSPLDGSYGGVFASVFPTIGNLIPAYAYRKLLKAVAQIKYNGLSLDSIDALCQVFGTGYTIGYGLTIGDIYITWSAISTGDLWLMQKTFDLFTTSPQVFVQEV